MVTQAMDDKAPAISQSWLRPAGRAATTSLWLALASVVSVALGLWLANFFGPAALLIGLILWLVAWIACVALAVNALLNAGSSARPQKVRLRAITGLAAAALSLALVAAFLWGLIRAIQQLT